MFKDAGLDAIVCDTYLDPHFISFAEYKEPKRIRFLRIDADVDEALKAVDANEGDAEKNGEIEKVFTEILKEKNVTVQLSALKNGEIPAIINVNEFMRRMNDMNRYYGMNDMAQPLTLVVNTASELVQSVKELSEEKKKFFVNHIYYLALLSYRKLTPEEMQEFTANNLQLLKEFSK